jgi:ankyrin repeat protein
MDLSDIIGNSIEHYLLDLIYESRYPLENYRVEYEHISDNSIQVTLSVAQGIFALFKSRNFLHDIRFNLNEFQDNLLEYLREQFREYDIYLDSLVDINQTIVLTISYYPKVELPPDVIQRILSFLPSKEVQRISRALPGYQNILENEYIWYQFVMNTYGPYYKLFKEIPLNVVNWKELYQELEKLRSSEKTPMIFNKFLFNEAIRQNAIELVKIMLKDPLIDPNDPSESPHDNPYLRLPLKLAAERNNIAIVQMLLADPRVDPSIGDNISLGAAIFHKFYPVVEMLLKDPRIKPNHRNLIVAIRAGYQEVFDEILPYIDPSYDNNDAIIAAAQFGNLRALDRLLDHPLVNPADQNNLALILASAKGNLDIVKRLLQDPRVDPSDQQNTALISASSEGHADVVSELLRDPRVDPLDQYFSALGTALEARQYDVLRILVANPVVQAAIPTMPLVLRNAIRLL